MFVDQRSNLDSLAVDGGVELKGLCPHYVRGIGVDLRHPTSADRSGQSGTWRRSNEQAQSLWTSTVSTRQSFVEHVYGTAFGGWAQNFPFATSRRASFSSSA